MQTKLCNNCKTVIPKTSKYCPNCKRRQVDTRTFTKIFFFIIIYVIMCVTVLNENNDKLENSTIQNETQSENTIVSEETETVEIVETEEEYKSSCSEYSYKDVLRNPDDYVGKRVKITIRISNVHETSLLNNTKYYFAYSENDYGWYGDRYAVFDERINNDMKLLSDDIIIVYGEIAEPEYTSSLILSSEELFVIRMKYMDFISE